MGGIFAVEDDPLPCNDTQITTSEAQERVLSVYPWLRSAEHGCCPWSNFEVILALRRAGLDGTSYLRSSLVERDALDDEGHDQ